MVEVLRRRQFPLQFGSCHQLVDRHDFWASDMILVPCFGWSILTTIERMYFDFRLHHGNPWFLTALSDAFRNVPEDMAGKVSIQVRGPGVVPCVESFGCLTME